MNVSNVLKTCVILTLIMTSACSSEKESLPTMKELNIYQPSTLHMKEGTQVKTPKGIYTAQKEEIWYSEKEFRQLERDFFGK